MQNARLDESQAGIKIAGRNTNNLGYADGTTSRAKSKEELKSLLMKMKGEREKAGLKLNIQKAKIMASGPISSVQFSRSVVSSSLRPHESQHARPPCPSPSPFMAIRWGKVETWAHFTFLDSKITVDGDYSHKIKGLLLQIRKAIPNLDTILKSRDITLLANDCVIKAMFFQ